MDTYKTNWFKFIIGFAVCLLIRLIPFRPPNIEPILATQMPFAKAYGPWVGFSFAFVSIVLFDLISGKLGVWTLLTALTYGVLGIWSAYFFRKRKMQRFNYVFFALIGTLFFDGVTGLSIGPLFFHQSLSEAFFGQIPFTIMHLAGNMGLAIVLSPFVYRFIISNKKLETASLVAYITTQHI